MNGIESMPQKYRKAKKEALEKVGGMRCKGFTMFGHLGSKIITLSFFFHKELQNYMVIAAKKYFSKEECLEVAEKYSLSLNRGIGGDNWIYLEREAEYEYLNKLIESYMMAPNEFALVKRIDIKVEGQYYFSFPTILVNNVFERMGTKNQ